MNKRILFLVNGLGLGNSTRCYAIIQRLKRSQTKIAIMTSGNGSWFFENKSEIDEIFYNKALHYGKNNNQLSTFNTLKSLSVIFKTIKENSKKLLAVINEYKPDVIVTDSVYNFPIIKKLSIPLIGVNNADLTIDYFKKTNQKPLSIYPQHYFVESLDNLYHKIFPDLVISPCILKKDHNENINKKKIRRVGPIFRLEIKKRKKRNIERGAIMLSGSSFGLEVNLKKNLSYHLDIIGREKPINAPVLSNQTFHGKILHNTNLLNNIDFCVVNAGYSALSELYWAKIPMVVIPILNHSEQWTNAIQIKNGGCGIISSNDNYENDLQNLLINFEMYEKNYDMIDENSDGAEEAKNLILNI